MHSHWSRKEDAANNATVVNVVGQRPALQMHVDQPLYINLLEDIRERYDLSRRNGIMESHWLRMAGLMGRRAKLRERHGRTA
jgi:hypothetical protein